MPVWLIILATQVPFVLYMALVPPERRALPRTWGAAVLVTIALGAAGYGGWLLHRGEPVGRVWLGFAVFALLMAVARWRGWVGPREPD